MSDARYELPALPIDSLIASPLLGVMSAQLATSRRYAEFLMGTCVDADGKAVAMEFDVDQPVVDGQGNPQGVQTHRLRLPLLAAIPHPNLNVKHCRIAFTMEITTSEHEAALEAGPQLADPRTGGTSKPATFYGRVSHRREQERSSDSRARIAMEIEAERGDPPESLMRIIDFLTDTLTRPVRVREGDARPVDALRMRGAGGPEAPPAPDAADGGDDEPVVVDDDGPDGP